MCLGHQYRRKESILIIGQKHKKAAGEDNQKDKSCYNFEESDKFFASTTELISPVREDTLCDVIMTLLSVLSSNVEQSVKRIAEIKLVSLLSNIKVDRYLN
jgi:hypothetical protein